MISKNFWNFYFKKLTPSIFAFCFSVHFHWNAFVVLLQEFANCIPLIFLFGDDSIEEEMIEHAGDDSAEQKAESSSSSSETVEKPI